MGVRRRDDRPAPVVEIMTVNFSLLATPDVNHAAPSATCSAPCEGAAVVRMHQGAVHSAQADALASFEGIFLHVPACLVAVVRRPRRPKVLLKTAIRYDNP